MLTPKNENNYEVTQYIPREDDPYSISSNSVYSILQDSKGRMWIGTWGGGINLIDHSSENGHIRFIHSGIFLIIILFMYVRKFVVCMRLKMELS